MTDVFIERRRDKTYRATQNKRTIAAGDTQKEAIEEARDNRKNPDDPMFAEHV
jgi:hypothetical protein